MKQGEHEMAEGCFAAAMAHTATLTEACSSTAVPDARREQLMDSLAGLYTCRAQAAWALQQEVRLVILLHVHITCKCPCAKARATPFGCAHCRLLNLTAAAAAATQELATQMLQQANELLAIDLLSGRQVVKLSIGLAHVLTLEVFVLLQTCPYHT